MGRKILSVSLDEILPAICRDDRKRVSVRSMMVPDSVGSSPMLPFITCDGMPDDARIVDVRPNPAFRGQLDFLVESAEFPDTLPGYTLPEMDVRLAHYASYETYLEVTKPKADAPAEVAPKRGREFI